MSSSVGVYDSAGVFVIVGAIVHVGMAVSVAIGARVHVAVVGGAVSSGAGLQAANIASRHIMVVDFDVVWFIVYSFLWFIMVLSNCPGKIRGSLGISVVVGIYGPHHGKSQRPLVI